MLIYTKLPDYTSLDHLYESLFFGTAYKVGLGNYYILVGLIEATDEYCHVNRGHDQMM